MRFWIWLNALVGRHVCEEFTQWGPVIEDREMRPPTWNEHLRCGIETMVVNRIRRSQSRRCTICGRIYLRRLKGT